ncbi:MAG: glycosyltransferase family 2 protein [Actinomycetales bacterium]|nr:glycosyltransferase family 2 protein [Actinomycetales bacterium]
MKTLIALARKALASGPIPVVKYAVMRLIWWFSFRFTIRDSRMPKVSIVVPVYNVEAFLADALRSARAQNWPNLEIIVVNDGATDGSAAIIDRFFYRTPFLRGVVQPNAGLGAARNTGLAAIDDTDYVMFLDSDDLLPLGAVKRFVEKAESTGSPLVVGKAVCFYGARYFDRTSTAAFFRKTRDAISVNELPEILGDATSWNKLYNWQFWQANHFKFPEGVAYEDMTLVVTAYLAAKQFDLIADASYFWRVRAEGESLSKRRTELKSLQDRLLSMEQIDKILKLSVERGFITPLVHLTWLTRIISLDLPLFVESLPVTDQAFFDELHSRAGKLLADAPEQVWTEATGKHRKAVWAAVHGSREQTLKLLAE